LSESSKTAGESTARQSDIRFQVWSMTTLKGNKAAVAVEVSQDERVITMQLSPAKTREIALYLLEVAEAAEFDTMMVHFGMNQLGLPIEHAVGIVHDLRNYRRKQGKIKGGRMEDGIGTTAERVE
jgi:hypothetical protein